MRLQIKFKEDLESMIKKIQKISAVILSTLTVNSSLAFAEVNKPKINSDKAKTVLKYSAAVIVGMLIKYICDKMIQNVIQKSDYDFEYDKNLDIPQKAINFLNKIKNQPKVTDDLLNMVKRFIESISYAMYNTFTHIDKNTYPRVAITVKSPNYKLEASNTADLAKQIAETLIQICDNYIPKCEEETECKSGFCVVNNVIFKAVDMKNTLKNTLCFYLNS